MALQPQQNIKPQYIVQKIEGTVPHTTAKVDQKSKDGGFVYVTADEPGGWMVFFPSGSSIRVRTDDELVRLGFDSPANLIDMDTGEVVGPMPDMSFQTMTSYLPDNVKETSITETKSKTKTKKE